MEQEERVIPIDILDEFLKLCDEHPISNEMLYNEDDEIRQDAEENIKKLKDFLLSKGLTHEECDKLIEKSLEYFDLRNNPHGSSSSRLLGLAVFVISGISALILTGYNIYLYKNERKIWNLTLFLNIGAFLVVLASIKSILGGSEMGIEQGNSECERLIKEHGEYASYLMNEHGYTREAIAFYFAENAYNLSGLEDFVEQLTKK